MSSKAIFYHAGCPVSLDAESLLIGAIDKSQYHVDIVDIADQPERIAEAESAGVRSVPALVLEEEVFHINFGTSLVEVKASL